MQVLHMPLFSRKSFPALDLQFCLTAQGVFSQSADYAIYVCFIGILLIGHLVFACIVTVSFEYVERKCPEMFLVAHLWFLSLCCGFTRFP